jgi:GNAT superfamily N-acetyltransferase
MFSMLKSLLLTFRPYRSVSNPSSLTAYLKALPFIEHYWPPPRDQNWELSVLGVIPGQQGKGIGKRLTVWGLERAESEGVAAAVVSAAGKEGFYRSCGFGEPVGRATDGEGNPLGGVEGLEIMFRDPSDTKAVDVK